MSVVYNNNRANIVVLLYTVLFLKKINVHKVYEKRKILRTIQLEPTLSRIRIRARVCEEYVKRYARED